MIKSLRLIPLVFFYNIIKVNHFLYCFIILLNLFFHFLYVNSLLVPYTCVSIESIILSLLGLNPILLTSSTNELRIIHIFVVMLILIYCFCNFLWPSFRLYRLTLLFPADLFYFRVELLLNSFYNLWLYVFFFLFMSTFRDFNFFFHCCCLLNSCTLKAANSFIIFPPNSCFIEPVTFWF